MASASKGEVCCDVNLSGKTILITGSNQGIGYETAFNLAGRGGKVLMACRDIEKAEAAKKKILETHSNAEIVCYELDLSSFTSIRQCAKAVTDAESRLDILINNAGVMCCPKWKTKEGFEMHLGVNHIGHFLLTDLLLDLIKKSTPSRIVIVSSDGYRRGRMKWDDIMHDEDYVPFNVYFDSKLANVHHCLELSRRLEGTGVTCNCLHPGLVKTNLGQYMRGDHTPFFQRIMFKIFWPLAMLAFITPKEGAQTSIYCAIAPELEDVTGKYFAKCLPVQLLPHAMVEKDAARLWEMTEKWIHTDTTTNDNPTSS